MTENRKAVIEKTVELLTNRGDSINVGELVTQTEHTLQTAHLAERSGLPGVWLYSKSANVGLSRWHWENL